MNFGRFSVSRHLIDNEPEVVAEALSGIIVLDARYNYAMQKVDYVGKSAHFKHKVMVGQEAPEYTALISEERGIEWKLAEDSLNRLKGVKGLLN